MGEYRVSTDYMNAAGGQFTIPNGITVVMVSTNVTSDAKRYIGVTPGKTYKLIVIAKPPLYPPFSEVLLIMLAHNNIVWFYASEGATNFIISWSSEINSMAPTIKDY